MRGSPRSKNTARCRLPRWPQPAIRIARDGFPVYPHMANFIRDNEKAIRRFPSTVEIYLPQGRPPELGEKFVQSDLAATLQFLADEERAASRHGRIAGLQRGA